MTSLALPHRLAAARAAALAALLAGCATAGTPAGSPPSPEPRTPPATAPAAVPTPPPRTDPVLPQPAPAPRPELPSEAPADWHLLDAATDRVVGTGASRAVRELLVGKQPRRTVLVAVIDGGVDTSHAALRRDLWHNPKEVPGNGRDDDGNGYADDVRGWNFIGGRDGRDVHWDTYEVTRLYARCTGAPAASTDTSGAPAAPRCDTLATEYRRQRAEAEQQLQQVRSIDAALSRIVPLLKQAAGTDSLTPARVRAISGGGPQVQEARRVYLQLAAVGLTPAALEEARTELDARVTYGLNLSFNPRPIVGDRYADAAERGYGNADVMGPDAKHGTHVAGIIARIADLGDTTGRGGTPAVRIMMVRAVPDGDERDKDVANAIRYAADNGARIINMSFGKAYSPRKAVVDDAVRYAESRGVLLVHAAGNEGESSDERPQYPSALYVGGGRALNWIEVGASSWKGLDSLAAPFSNYSRDRVDVFAPGVDIRSTVPGGGYQALSGTSMAAPVVSGIAALLMAYYPDLTAADVKRIILSTATRYAEQPVGRPGSGARVPFGSLSSTGGVVNAYAALRMAAGAP